MEYIAAVSGSSAEIDKVKDKLLESNPILEGKTITTKILILLLIIIIVVVVVYKFLNF